MQKLFFLALLAQLILTSLTASWSNKGAEGGIMLFPDDKKLSQKPTCRTPIKNSYCTDVQHYPSAEIDNLIKLETKLFQDQFKITIPLDDVNVTTRIDDTDFEYMCESETFTEYPKIVITTDNRQVTIVNTPEFKQAVRIVKCKDEGKQCNHSISLPNKHTKTKCQQEFFHYKLTAYDANNKDKLHSVYVPFACCCRCALYKNP